MASQRLAPQHLALISCAKILGKAQALDRHHMPSDTCDTLWSINDDTLLGHDVDDLSEKDERMMTPALDHKLLSIKG